MSLDDFDQGVVRRPSPACTKPLITSEQSSNRVLVTGQQGSSSQISSNEVCLHTLWGESKSADGETRCSPQQDHIPSQGQGIERGRLHSRFLHDDDSATDRG